MDVAWPLRTRGTQPAYDSKPHRCVHALKIMSIRFRAATSSPNGSHDVKTTSQRASGHRVIVQG